MNEKRLFPRKRLKTKVFFEDELGEPLIWFESSDISVGGIFLEGPVPIRVGSHIFLSFELSGRRVSATGEVMRTTKGGTGVRFVGLSDADISLIEKFVTT